MRGYGVSHPLLEEIERVGHQQPHFRASVEHVRELLGQVRPVVRQETGIGMEVVVVLPFRDEIESGELGRLLDNVQRLSGHRERLGKGRGRD